MNPYTVKRPNPSNQERLITEQLVAQTAHIDMLVDPRVGPPLDVLFPPRFGSGPSRPPTIFDVLKTEVPIPNYRATASGVPADFTSSSRPSGSGWW